MSPEPADSEQLAEGTLISHLLELRSRLLKAVVAVFIVFTPLAFYANDLYTFVAQPLIGHPLPLHLFLEHHDAVDEALGTRWTAGYVHVHGNDRVDPLHHGVIVEHPA